MPLLKEVKVNVLRASESEAETALRNALKLSHRGRGGAQK